MIDEPFRKWLARRWSAPVAWMARVGVTPNQVTVAATVLGVASAGLVSFRHVKAGLALWLLGRLLDGYDGMLARATGRTSLFGGYLDITLDMLAYCAMAVAFAVAMPADALLWIGVVAGYVLSITTTLALSSLTERAGRPITGNRSIRFSAAVAEGGETTLVYCLIALFPGGSRWVLLAWLALLALSVIQRTRLAHLILRE